MLIREFRVLGAKELPGIEVEETVYPFLGLGRTFDDVEKARAALEKTFQDKGYKTAQVVIPEQTGHGGIVTLQVLAGKVGALHVTGARYFMPSRVKAQAQSLAEGKVINFNDVTRDIVSLNQLADRRVEPKLTPRLGEPGVFEGEPGVFDIDLIVKDKSPLHGSIELNNRSSANTTELRLNGSLSYANLWQRGHTLGASYQTSPEDLSEVKVFSGFYIARFAGVDDFSLMLTGTKQDSNVSTLGSAAVAGKGNILGVRGIFTLPTLDGFFQSLSVGVDYKKFEQAITLAGVTDSTPITYYPLSATWDGTWLHSKEVPDLADPAKTKRAETGSTELSLGVTFGLRGTGSRTPIYIDDKTKQRVPQGTLGAVRAQPTDQFEANRLKADGNFIYVHGSLAHTQKLRNDWELFSKISGQASDQPLVNSEQFGGGGMGTARGYLEAEALGDNGLFSTLELRTPSLLRMKRTVGTAEESTGNEWRFYAFGDMGTLTLHDVANEQQSSFRLASMGLGSELQLAEHFHGLLEFAIPFTTLSTTHSHDASVNFRLWADF